MDGCEDGERISAYPNKLPKCFENNKRSHSCEMTKMKTSEMMGEQNGMTGLSVAAPQRVTNFMALDFELARTLGEFST